MKNVTIPSQFLQELLALCGPEDHELRERVLKSAAPTHPAEGVPEGWRDQLEQVLCDLQTGPYPATALAVKRLEKLLATQQVLDADTQHNADIGAAVMRACKDLPEGAEIQIYLERGAGTVHMTDWDGNEFDHFDEDHEDFACRINAATDGAIAAEKVAAQAKQGEQENG